MTKTLLAIAAFAALATAADKPNFSGSWKMDPDKSTFGPIPPPTSMSRKIDHNDPALNFVEERSAAQGDQTLTFKYTTDGKETTNELMGNPVKGTANWDGAALVIAMKADFGGNEIKLTDKWTLSDDGKTLTDAQHIVAPQGEIDVTYVLKKQ
jgi:hypothetical protein